MSFSPTSMIDKPTAFFYIGIVAVVAIFFFIFYSIATTSHPQMIVPKPPSGFGTSSPFNMTVPDGFTFKLVQKNGWHPCVEDVGVWCKGPYVLNQTIQKYQTLRPPPFPSALNMTQPQQQPQLNPLPPSIGNFTPFPQFKPHGNNITELLPPTIKPQGCPDDIGVWCFNETIIK